MELRSWLKSKCKSLSLNLLHKDTREQELSDEVRAYIEMATEERVAAGMPAAEARRAVLTEMGGAEQVKGAVREIRTGVGIETVLQDLRFGLRQLQKSPGFGVTVIVTLGLSIGITTAVFSVLYAMVIRPLPYHDPERIVAPTTVSPHGSQTNISYPEYLDWKQRNHSFQPLAGFSPWQNLNLESGTGPIAIPVVSATDNFFDVFEVKPLLGRTFLPGEDQDGKNDLVVLSYEVWQQNFGGTRSVLGQQVKLDAKSYTVIGVMPAGFRFPINKINAVYTPLHLTAQQRGNRGNHWLNTVARLKPGVMPAQAEADMNIILADIDRKDAFYVGRKMSARDLPSYVLGDTSSSLRLLLWAVLALLFVGCVNVAGLLLARGVKREREMALRSAIGANRLRIIRQILTEALLFAFCGAALGIGLAYGLLRVMRLLLIAALSRGGEIGLSVPILLVSLAITIIVTVIAAMIPALRLSGTAPSSALKSGGNSGTSRSQHRLRAAFVVTQVSLALSFLVVSGLLMHALSGLRNADLGFSPDNILTVEIDLSKGKYEGANLLTSFYQPLLDRVRSIPGVQSAGTIQLLPIQAWGWNWEHIHIIGTPPLRENRTAPAEIRFVTPGYYQVFEDRLIAGRLAEPGLDRPDTRLVTVVNEAFVKKFVPAGWNPIGLEIGDDQQKDTLANTDNPRVTIIGVVKNIRQAIYREPMPEVDYMIAQVPQVEGLNVLASTHLVVRTAGDPKSIIPALRNAFHEVDPTLPFRTPLTMREVVADTLTFERLENWLFGSFAGLAILLAIVGLYGLISHEVELSTREIGVRLALGATRKKIVAGIYTRVSWMLGCGTVIGLALIMTVQKYINSVVTMEVEKDAGKILLLTAMLLCAGLLAALLPARKASSVDPMEALREE